MQRDNLDRIDNSVKFRTSGCGAATCFSTRRALRLCASLIDLPIGYRKWKDGEFR
jgi:hypothetical protein